MIQPHRLRAAQRRVVVAATCSGAAFAALWAGKAAIATIAGLLATAAALSALQRLIWEHRS